MVRLSLLSAMVACAAFVPSTLASRFTMTQCQCNDGFSFVRSLTTTATYYDGSESTVEDNYNCDSDGHPNYCAGWQLLNICVDTGICGVGKLCYNSETTDSDEFSINGNTYKKNDYTNNYYSGGDGRCESLCANYGWASITQHPSDYHYVIEGYPQPSEC